MANRWFRLTPAYHSRDGGGVIVAFYLLLISAIFGLSKYVPRFIGNLAVLAIVVTFTAIALSTTLDVPLDDIFHKQQLPTLPIQYHSTVLVSIAILWAVFLIGLVLNFTPKAILRTGAFILLSAVIFFVVPAVVSRERAFQSIAIVGASCVAVVLPPVLIGDITISGLVLDWAGPSFSRGGIILHVPNLIFRGLNYFRVLVAFGAVAAAGLYAQTRERWLFFICALNLFGVYVTLGRAAHLAILIAAGLAGVYYIRGSRAVLSATVVGVGVIVVGFAIGLGILPGPTATIQSVLGDRISFYRASWQAFTVRPLLGWGLVDTRAAIMSFAGTFTGVHNSYLRFFVIGGVVGGLAYLGLCANALRLAFRALREQKPLALTGFCLVVMALVFQLFSGGTVFGTSLSSILWALVIAYAQPDSSQHLIAH